MEAHRLQIWLNEHGLAEIGADIRETTDSAAPGLHDPTAPVGPMVSVGLKFAQLARPGGASGRGRSRSGGRGSTAAGGPKTRPMIPSLQRPTPLQQKHQGSRKGAASCRLS